MKAKAMQPRTGPLLLWLCWLFIGPLCLQAQNLVDAEYFFDQDPGVGQGTALSFDPDLTPQLEVTAPAGGLGPGYHLVSFRFKADDGAWSPTAAVYFYVNGPVPAFTANLLDLPVSRAEYFWNSDPGPGNGTPFFIPTGYESQVVISPNAPLSAGLQRFGLRCRDLNGSWGIASWAEVNVTGDPDLNAPIASFNFGPQPILAGDQVAFTSTSQNGSPQVLLQWDMNGDGLPDYNGNQVFHNFAAPGTYPVRLTVINRPSALARTANVRYYFRNSVLTNAGGIYGSLTAQGTVPFTEGRQADMRGARQTGPGLLQATGNGTVAAAFSVSFWFKGSLANSGNKGIRIAATNGFGFTAFENSTSHRLGNNNINAGTTQQLYTGKWNHIALSYANGQATTYLNGQQVGTATLSGAPSFALNTLTIGGLSSSDFATGTFDDLLVYTSALSAAEVQTLYNEIYASTRIENVQVGPLQNLQPTLVGDSVFCAGDFSILFAPEADSYLWNTGATTQSIEVTESGSYACMLNAGGSLFTTNAVQIEVIPVPQINLSVNDASNGAANGSAGTAVSGGSSFLYTYTWSSGASQPSVQGLSGGNYSITVDDGKCPVTESFTVANLNVPAPAGVAAAEYFIGSDPGPGNGTPFGITQGDEVGAFADIPLTGLAVGIYSISVRTRDGNGTWGITRSAQISINTPEENPVLDPAENLIAGEYFFDNIDPGPGNAFPLASFGPDTEVSLSDNLALNDLAPGQHRIHVRLKDADGSWGITGTQIFTLEFVLPPTLPDALSNFAEAEYFIGNVDPGVGNASPIPVPALTDISINRSIDVSDLPEGAYRINVRTRDVGRQWSVTRSSNFLVEAVECPVPVVNFNAGTANAGSPLALINASSNATQGTTVAWDINADGSIQYTSINASHVFPAPGTYDVALTIDNGDPCTVTLIKQVVVGPVLSRALTASGPIEFCEGGTVTFTAPAGSGHLWNNYAEGPSITVSTSGTYQCAYTDIQGNQVLSEVREVVVFPRMELALSANDASNGLPNGSAGVVVSGGNTSIYSYAWSTGSTAPIAVGLLPGNYQLLVSDGICPENLEVAIGNQNVPAEGIQQAEFFWGLTDPGTGNATPLLFPQGEQLSSFANIPTAGLEPGYRFLSVRMREANGAWGITRTLPVVLVDPDAEVVDPNPIPMVAAEYFLGDEDPGPGNGVEMPSFAPTNDLALADLIETILLDLEPGPVRLNVRTKNALGNWSMTEAQNFFIEVTPLPNLKDVQFPIVAAEYFLGDEDPGAGNAISVSVPVGEFIAFPVAINLQGLTPGEKRLTIRVLDVGGHWSMVRSTTFEVVPVTCPVPVVSFTASAALPGQNSNLVSTSTNLLSGATYAWDFNADGIPNATGATAQLPVSSAGVYPVSLAVNNGNGCVSSAVQQLTFGNIPGNDISADGPLAFCAGGSVSLTAPAGSNYIWNDGSTGSSIEVADAGSFAVSYTDINGNAAVSEELNVTVYPLLEIETLVYAETNGLSNGSAGVLVSGGSTFIYEYLWNTGATAPIVTELAAGNYSVQVSDPHCPETIDLLLPSGNVSAGIAVMEYFWDGVDPGTGNALGLPVSQGVTALAFGNIPTVGLTPGYHFLSVRAKDPNKGWGIARTLPVYLGDPNPVPPAPEAPDLVALEYFYDSDPGASFATELLASVGPVTGGSYDLSTAGLAPGGHRISVRAKDADGEWGITRSAAFNTCNPPSAPEVLLTEFFLCEGDDLSFTAEDDGFALTWTTPDGSMINGAEVNLSNVTTNDNGAYFVIAESDPGCFGPLTQVMVNVLQAPVINALVTGPPVICNLEQSAELFIPPVAFATNYNWQLPAGAEIISGNNTNNIAIDFSNVAGTQATIVLAVSNLCGSDTASAFLINFTCGAVCNVDGGSLSASGNLNPCVGDGAASNIQLSVSGNLGNSRFGMIKVNGDIVATNSSGLFNMDNYPTGTYRFGHLSFGQGFSFTGVSNISQLSGCYDNSNLITVNTFTPNGGTISLAGSNTVCSGTGSPIVLPFSVSGSVGPNKRWVVLNQSFSQAIALSANPNFNWDNFVPGTYRVVHVAYSNDVNLSQQNPQNPTGCIDASNSITVNVQACAGIVLQAQPNPTSGPSTAIFSIENTAYTTLEVFDMNGRNISTLFNQVANAGQEYRIDFDGTFLPNGVYIYRLTTENEVVVEKFMIAR